MAKVSLEPDSDTCEPDSDGDKVANACDLCPGTVPGVSVDAFGCPPAVPGDFNRDGDVDASDFEAFEKCATGPGVTQGNTSCTAARLDGDDDVDQIDFGLFQRCLSGEDVPANPNCGN